MKKSTQGILTVEASIVLTLMLLFILFFFSFGRVYRAQNLVSHASLQSVDAVAMESFLRETALQSDAAEIVYLASYITDSAAISSDSLESLRSANIPKIAKQKFIAAIASSEAKADEKLRSMGVKNGLSGIDFSECKMDLANDDVIVAVKYTIEMQFPVFGFNEITVTKAAKAKTFGEILFEISTRPNNPDWGSTSGDNKVAHGSTVEIVATPNYGYKFVCWSDGVTDNPRTVTVTDTQQYIAIFEKDQLGINLGTKIIYNTSHVGITHANYGTVTGAGSYPYLDYATITATPNKNYEFVGWDDNGDGVVDNTEQTREISVDRTYNIKAIFKPVMCSIAVNVNNSGYGSAQVTQGSRRGSTIQAEYGSRIQLIAVPNDSVKYIFSKWNNNSTQATTTVTVDGDATYRADFILNTYKVSFYNGNTLVHTTEVIRGSSINGSRALTGSSMPANPTKAGAIFDKWVGGGTTFSSTTRVNANLTVKATFVYPSITLSGGTAGGVSTTLTAKTNPADVKVTWTSSNSNVAEVDRNGKVTVRSGGTTTITAAFVLNGETYSASKTVTVVIDKIYLKEYNYRTNLTRHYYNKEVISVGAGGEISWSASERTYNNYVYEKAYGCYVRTMAVTEAGLSQMRTVAPGSWSVRISGTSQVGINMTNETGYQIDNGIIYFKTGEVSYKIDRIS